MNFDEYPEVDESREASRQNVYEELSFAREEIAVLNTALLILKKRLDDHGISYFDDSSYVPLPVKPSEMSREELVDRNKGTTFRIEKTRHAKSSDGIPQATQEQCDELYKEMPIMNESVKALFEALKNNQKVVYVKR